MLDISPDIIKITTIIGLPKLEPIPGTKLKRLIEAFWVYSVKLNCWILIPKGFVYDEESTPWRGENPIAGLIHDYLSRKDSKPLVTKWQAAMVYDEFMYFEDSQINRKWYTEAHDWLWRGLKSGFVAVCPDSVYWHKHSVSASCKEMNE